MFSFTDEQFSRLGDDASHLEGKCRAHEGRTETLLATAERDVKTAAAALAGPRSVTQDCITGLVAALRVQLHKAQQSVDSTRELWLSARSNRITATHLVTALGGDAEPEAPPPEISRKAVLVVDDYTDTRELVSTVLQRAGFIVRTASNGLEALLAAYEIRPAVILMDMMMPVLNGLEATRLIKAIDAVERTPVIAYTAKPAEADVIGSHLFAAVLKKPASPDVVLATVRQWAAAQA